MDNDPQKHYVTIFMTVNIFPQYVFMTVKITSWKREILTLHSLHSKSEACRKSDRNHRKMHFKRSPDSYPYPQTSLRSYSDLTTFQLFLCHSSSFRLYFYFLFSLQGDIAARSAPLLNMEPLKCEDWKWVKWSDIVHRKNTEPRTLFDPIRHMLKDLGDDVFLK